MSMEYGKQLRQAASQTVEASKDEIEIMSYEVLEKYATDYLQSLLKKIVKEKCKVLLEEGVPLQIVQKVKSPLLDDELLAISRSK